MRCPNAWYSHAVFFWFQGICLQSIRRVLECMLPVGAQNREEYQLFNSTHCRAFMCCQLQLKSGTMLNACRQSLNLPPSTFRPWFRPVSGYFQMWCKLDSYKSTFRQIVLLYLGLIYRQTRFNGVSAWFDSCQFSFKT